MQAKLRQMGNSQGIPVPKAILQQLGLHGAGDIVSMEVEDHKLVISPVRRVREGWRESIEKSIREEGGIDIDKSWDRMTTKFDEEEWDW